MKNVFAVSVGVFLVGLSVFAADNAQLARSCKNGSCEMGKAKAKKNGTVRRKNKTDSSDLNKWMKIMHEIKSTYDGKMQKCYFWAPEKAKTEAVPLIVGLHTWSGSWKNVKSYAPALKYAQAHGWAMVGPDFRGPNCTPEACGGDPAVQDVVDAVNFAKSKVKIDDKRVYIMGGSGGGHLTLLMAGRHPEIWAGCAAFCPITDLMRWHADSILVHPGRSKKYAEMMEKSCGGTPAEKPEEYRHRSPLTWLDNAKKAKVPVYIVTGIHDGWKGSVPVGHSFRAFNALAEKDDMVEESDIAAIEETRKVPESIGYKGPADPFYSEKMRIHFRRTSANVRFTLFEGGHGGNTAAGLDFLSRQVKGQSADFSLPEKAKAKEEKLEF
jgi:poly(3-hydroxybutyrate) depolymerase